MQQVIDVIKYIVGNWAAIDAAIKVFEAFKKELEETPVAGGVSFTVSLDKSPTGLKISISEPTRVP